MIKGITVTLYAKTLTGYDEFKEPIYAEAPVSVDNVLVTPTNSSEIVNEFTLDGRTAIYQLAIPKGDTHDWRNARVDFFGESFETFGEPIRGIDENIPLSWNTKVYVSRYEEG